MYYIKQYFCAATYCASRIYISGAIKRKAIVGFMQKETSLSQEIGPISAETIVDMVELRLRVYIKKKQFRPGDALPKEKELAEALAVSRNVVREALSRLRMLGIVESKKKRGMILASPDILGVFERVLDPNIITKDTLKNVFELRLALEMGLIDILFNKKLTDKDLAELEAIAQKQVGSSVEFRIKHEIEFHGKLYEMTGNDTLKRFQTMLLPLFDYMVKLKKKNVASKVSHQDLVKLLKKGDKEAFRKGMYEHLKPHFEWLRGD
jgi:GntR family transcriptional regulator, transcriptional repressor for pyruvate dehydrogenase complex